MKFYHDFAATAEKLEVSYGAASRRVESNGRRPW